MKVTRLGTELQEEKHVDTGAIDDKGRTVGFSGRIQRWKAEPWDSERNPRGGYYEVEGYTGGDVFAVTVQITRDGERFGALQREHLFLSLAAAQSYMLRTLNKRREAAQRKFMGV